jgi:hypothetical protein
MSRYTSGWTWRDGETMDADNPENSAACNRLYIEIVQLYHDIPDPADALAQHRTDCGYEAVYEERGREAADQWLRDRVTRARRLWGELAALEAMLEARGARLREPYEDLNEDAPRFARQESS